MFPPINRRLLSLLRLEYADAFITVIPISLRWRRRVELLYQSYQGPLCLEIKPRVGLYGGYNTGYDSFFSFLTRHQKIDSDPQFLGNSSQVRQGGRTLVLLVFRVN